MKIDITKKEAAYLSFFVLCEWKGAEADVWLAERRHDDSDLAKAQAKEAKELHKLYKKLRKVTGKC